MKHDNDWIRRISRWTPLRFIHQLLKNSKVKKPKKEGK